MKHERSAMNQKRKTAFIKHDIEEMVLQYNEDFLDGEPEMTIDEMMVILGLI